LQIGNSAGIRFINVGAEVSHDMDHVNATKEGCNATACNVVIGSMNAAMVVENSVRLASLSMTRVLFFCHHPSVSRKMGCTRSFGCGLSGRPLTRWQFPANAWSHISGGLMIIK
jgi:hypothetical protein